MGWTMDETSERTSGAPGGEPDFLIRLHTERGTLRRAVRTVCQVVAEEGFRLLGEETLDLSPRGLLLRSDAEATIGEPVFVALRTPRGQSWIDATGRVARIVRGTRRRDRGRALGVRFDRLAPIDAALLAASLRGFPPPAPARRVRRDYAGTVSLLMAS